MLVFAPLASAGDPFREQTCVDETHCYGAGTCVDAVCVPRSCQPATSCRAEVGPGATTCVTNLTIQGQTCQTFVGLGARDQRQVSLPGFGDASGTRVWFAAQTTDGHVDAHNLPNSWLAPGVEAEVEALGLDLGGVSVGVYRSEIVDEGPRGGPYGQISPSDNHTWSEIGVGVRHAGGPLGGEDVVVALWLLDLVPDGCFVRSPHSTLPEAECPRLHAPFA